MGCTYIFDSLQVISDGGSARLESETTAAESEAVRRKSSGTDCDDVYFYCLDFRVQHSGEAVTTANSYGSEANMDLQNNGTAHRPSPASSAGIECVEVLRGHLSARCTVFTNSATP